MPSPKRRKVRKGTFSCWECKNRKTRCVFRPTCSICVSCQRRGFSCVSQEFEAESDNGQAEKSIAHVEQLVNELVDQRNGPRPSIPDEPALVIMPNPSSGPSVSSYLDSIFPSSTIATAILERGTFLRLPGRVMLAGEELTQASERPLPSAHPVQFGRKLIQLALCLQQMNDPAYDASRYVEIVSHHVTSQDMLVVSLDGLETLMMEATYHINNGNLQAAWLTFRRALAIAQLLGLDRTDREDRASTIWFRLLCGDRYISLSLGLPLAVADNSFADLRGDTRFELERNHVVVSGRIIARNVLMQRLGELGYEETQDIDYLLKQAARYFPTSWWAFRSLNGLDEAEIMEMTARLVTQMHHHYFIVVLHQLYLVQGLCFPESRNIFSYSRMAIPPASREVLLRFLVLRGFHRGVSYRGVDDKAFTAMRALLLAHIDGHRLGKANVLEHQRPQDLKIILDAIDLIEDISAADNMVQSLKRLVEIESEATSGANYAWTNEGSVGLVLKIPYFGTMRAVLASPQRGVSQQDESQPLHPDCLEGMTFDLMSEIGDAPSFEQSLDVDAWD